MRFEKDEHQHHGLEKEKIDQLIRYCHQIPIDSAIITAVNELIRSSRPQDPSCPVEQREWIWYGSGPRGGISLISASRALAALEGKESVSWQHIRYLAKPVLRHRIRLANHIIEEETTVDQLIDGLLQRVEQKYKNLAQGIDAAP